MIQVDKVDKVYFTSCFLINFSSINSIQFDVCPCVVCVHVYMCVCMCTCVCACVHVCVDVYMCVLMCTCVY